MSKFAEYHYEIYCWTPYLLFYSFFGLIRWGNVLSSLVFNLRRSRLLPLPPLLASSLAPAAIALQRDPVLCLSATPRHRSNQVSLRHRQLDPHYASLRHHSEPPGRHHTETESSCRSGATNSRCGAVVVEAVRKSGGGGRSWRP